MSTLKSKPAHAPVPRGIGDLTYAIPTARRSISSRMDVKRPLPLSIRRLVSAPSTVSFSHATDAITPTRYSSSKRPVIQIQLTKKAAKPPARPIYLHDASSVTNALYTSTPPPLVPKTPSQRDIPDFLYFTVLRACQQDRGGPFHHPPAEVARDPFLKAALPGEAGFLSTQKRVLRTLLCPSAPRRDAYAARFAEAHATRHEIAVAVDKLFRRTHDFLEFYGVDYETGALKNPGDVHNRQLARFETVREKYEYLHGVFLWIVQGCFEREVWRDDGTGVDKEADAPNHTVLLGRGIGAGGAGHRGKQNQKHKQPFKSVDNLNRSLFGLFGVTRKEMSVKEKWKEDNTPPKPIPPGDIRSKGSEIRRTEAANAKKAGIPAGVKLLLKNERHGEGATKEEIQRVRKIMKYAHDQARIGKDPLDHRENLVTLDSKSYADWVREKEAEKFDTAPDSTAPDCTFSVREFITTFLQLQNAATPAITMDHIDAQGRVKPAWTRRILQKRNMPRLVIEADDAAGGSGPAPILDAEAVMRRRRESSMPGIRGSVARGLPVLFVTDRIGSLSLGVSGEEVVGGFRQSTLSRRRMPSASYVVLKSPVEILSAKAPAKNLWFLYHDEMVVILRKTGWERTKDELKILFLYFRSLPAFEKLSDFTVTQVCATTMNYAEYPKGKLIFKQNDSPEYWHIILTGSANVLKSYNGEIEGSKKVRTMEEGYGFGENGLMNDAIRAASIVTAECCEMIEMHKDDYNRVIRNSHRRSLEEMASFLQRISIFEDWKFSTLHAIASIMWFKSLQTSDILITEGEPCKHVYFVKEGAVCLYKRILWKAAPVDVKVAILGENSIIGMEGFINAAHDTDAGGDISSLFTVKAATPAEMQLLYAANMYDATDQHKQMLARQQVRYDQSKQSVPNIELEAFHIQPEDDFMDEEELANERKRAMAREKVKPKYCNGMMMDFRDAYNFAKMEVQDWVYDDLGDLVASSFSIGSPESASVEEEIKKMREGVLKSMSVNPQIRPSMNGVITPVHKRKALKGGTVLACAMATTAKSDLRDLGTRPKLLDITEEEVTAIHLAALKRERWAQKKKTQQNRLIKEIKGDCTAKYGEVVGERVRVTAELWR
ncbi:hypothetical protein BC830DRAFT_1134053 [Chytriomyces sp. MP71]|nr:hypothetical protein BC830DRAFT_1134053 [Chytriomyces sp. MP71]